jgi:hypothetical protein
MLGMLGMEGSEAAMDSSAAAGIDVVAEEFELVIWDKETSLRNGSAKRVARGPASRQGIHHSNAHSQSRWSPPTHTNHRTNILTGPA